MVWLRQTIAVMLVNLKTIPARLGSSAVAIIGIAGVVVVFVSVLSISAGFQSAMGGGVEPPRAIILRAGSDTEMTSGISGEEARLIKEAPGIRHEGGNPLASAELYAIVEIPKKSAPDSGANVPLRGIEPVAMSVRENFSIIEGRMLQFGTNEVIVGKAANSQYIGLNIGETLVSGQNRWKVVGIFEADGSVAETEVWCDVHLMQGAYMRVNSFSVMVVRLDSMDSFQPLTASLTKNPQLNVDVRREHEYYRSRSEAMTRLINTLGFGIAFLMGIGAVFGAVLTMYTAVATRTREIATLRALGFNTASVLVSVLAESLVLGAIGGIIGAAASYFGFNGYQTSTMNFQTFSQVAFAFRVTPALLATGLIYALAMGLVGGLLPAIRAARLPISSALREL
jgi:putative ABC transport system permease protein